MQWQAAGVTDRGLRRTENEDAYLVRADLGVFAVADGMGGHAAGDVASRMAVEGLERELTTLPPDAKRGQLERALRTAVERANLAIYERSAREPDKSGMGTTLTALVLRPERLDWTAAHVGDSRLYRLREGRLAQLTTDHTWVQEQVRQGLLAPEQARHHPFSNILTRALGVQADVDVDTLHGALEPGDLLLLCSDGLTAMLDDATLRELLDAPEVDLATLSRRLVEAANEHGGYDNVTAALIRAAA